MISAAELYRLIQDDKGGASRAGQSFYKEAAWCGRAARLSQEYRDMREASESQQYTDEGKFNPLRLGTYFHKLQEVFLRGQLDTEVWDLSGDVDENFIEAVRLFRGYQANWGSVLERWGARFVGAEFPLEAPVGMFPSEFTGRADLVIDIYDLDAVKRNTGLDLPSTGRYILDYKTAKSYNVKHEWEFRFSPQAAGYIEMYNHSYPEAPVVGFVFDVVYKHKTLIKEPKYDKKGGLSQGPSYCAYYQTYSPENLGAVQQLIQIGRYNYDNNIANPAGCFNTPYNKVCYWLTSGKCSRK